MIKVYGFITLFLVTLICSDYTLAGGGGPNFTASMPHSARAISSKEFGRSRLRKGLSLNLTRHSKSQDTQAGSGIAGFRERRSSTISDYESPRLPHTPREAPIPRKKASQDSGFDEFLEKWPREFLKDILTDRRISEIIRLSNMVTNYLSNGKSLALNRSDMCKKLSSEICFQSPADEELVSKLSKNSQLMHYIEGYHSRSSALIYLIALHNNILDCSNKVSWLGGLSISQKEKIINKFIINFHEILAGIFEDEYQVSQFDTTWFITNNDELTILDQNPVAGKILDLRKKKITYNKRQYAFHDITRRLYNFKDIPGSNFKQPVKIYEQKEALGSETRMATSEEDALSAYLMDKYLENIFPLSKTNYREFVLNHSNSYINMIKLLNVLSSFVFDDIMGVGEYLKNLSLERFNRRFNFWRETANLLLKMGGYELANTIVGTLQSHEISRITQDYLKIDYDNKQMRKKKNNFQKEVKRLEDFALTYFPRSGPIFDPNNGLNYSKKYITSKHSRLSKKEKEKEKKNYLKKFKLIISYFNENQWPIPHSSLSRLAERSEIDRKNQLVLENYKRFKRKFVAHRLKQVTPGDFELRIIKFNQAFATYDTMIKKLDTQFSEDLFSFYRLHYGNFKRYRRDRTTKRRRREIKIVYTKDDHFYVETTYDTGSKEEIKRSFHFISRKEYWKYLINYIIGSKNDCSSEGIENFINREQISISDSYRSLLENPSFDPNKRLVSDLQRPTLIRIDDYILSTIFGELKRKSSY